MNKKYIIVGFISVSGIFLASSAYFYQDSEQTASMVENTIIATDTMKKSPEVEEIEVKSSVAELETEVRSSVAEIEIEPEIVVDKTDDMLPPDIPENIPHDLYDGPQTFWRVDESDQSNDPEKYALKVDPKMIVNLQTGQTFDFFVPELNQTFQTDINTTKNSFNGNHIFKGDILHGQFGENISIVRGKILTFVTVATLQGVFSATINNVTGETILQSEESLNKNLKGPDGIAVDIPEVVPPEV